MSLEIPTSVATLAPFTEAYVAGDDHPLHVIEVEGEFDRATGELVPLWATGWRRVYFGEGKYMFERARVAADEIVECLPDHDPASLLVPMAEQARHLIKENKAWLSHSLETLRTANAAYAACVPGRAPWRLEPWRMMEPGDPSAFAVAAPGVMFWEPAEERHYLHPEFNRQRGGVVLERRGRWQVENDEYPLEVRCVQYAGGHGWVVEWVPVGSGQPEPRDDREVWRLFRCALDRLVTPPRPGRGGGVAPAKSNRPFVQLYPRGWAETLRVALELGAILHGDSNVVMGGAA